MTSHDQLFKDLFRCFWADLWRLCDPAAASRLDLAKIRFLDKETFTDWPEGERREMDLLAEAPGLEEGEDAVLLHVEIEAVARHSMGRRVWRYFHLLQARDDRPVLSIVTFLKGGEPGVRLTTLEYKVLGQVRGHLDYVSFGLAGCRAEDYLERPEPLAWALAALMRPERLSRAELKIACLRRIARSGLNEIQVFLLVNCVETYLQLRGRDASEYAALQEREQNREVRAVKMTWAEQMEAKGRKEGIQQVLLRQLGMRFGPLPESVQHKVESISSMRRLNELAEKLLVARSLDEMGLA